MNNQTISVFIVDDEELARERLKRLLLRHPRYELIGEASNGETAIEKISNLEPDIVLLDIRMPGSDGLEVAAQLTSLNASPAIIFCTAYDEYAIQAFKHQAMGYLLKPVREEELVNALTNAKQVNKLQLRTIDEQNNDLEPPFVAHSWQGKELIPFNSIYFFRSEQKYLTVVHHKGETISDQTLKELEQKYPEKLLRAHRNTLVNIHYISAMTKDSQGHYFLQIKNTDHKISISRRHVTEIKNRLESFS